MASITTAGRPPADESGAAPDGDAPPIPRVSAAASAALVAAINAADAGAVAAAVGAAPNLVAAADGDGLPFLVQAVTLGDGPTVAALLDGADAAALATRGGAGTVALQRAAEVGRVGLVRALLRAGVPATVTDARGLSVLHVAAAEGDHPDVIDELLGFGAAPAAEDHLGRTALRLAVRHRHRATVERLCAAGAGVEDGADQGSLLVEAVEARDAALIDVLVAQGANVNHLDSHGYTPLVAAVLANDADMMEAVLRVDGSVDVWVPRGVVPAPDFQEYAMALPEGALLSPLHVAIAMDASAAVVERLAREDACLAALVPGTRETALHLAVSFSTVEVIQVLLSHNADVDGRDADGVVPLELAVYKQAVDKVRTLVQGGANPHAPWSGEVGLTIEQVAARRFPVVLPALHGQD